LSPDPAKKPSCASVAAPRQLVELDPAASGLNSQFGLTSVRAFAGAVGAAL
jgi:hypothetical protein